MCNRSRELFLRTLELALDVLGALPHGFGDFRGLFMNGIRNAFGDGRAVLLNALDNGGRGSGGKADGNVFDKFLENGAQHDFLSFSFFGVEENISNRNGAHSTMVFVRRKEKSIIFKQLFFAI